MHPLYLIISCYDNYFMCPFCHVCIYVVLFHFPHFLYFFLNIVYLTVLNDNACPINFHVVDLMIYNDESIGWVMSYWWLIYNCFSRRSYKVPLWQARCPQRFHYFIPSETLCVVNGLYSNDHLMDMSEYSLLYGEKLTFSASYPISSDII